MSIICVNLHNTAVKTSINRQINIKKRNKTKNDHVDKGFCYGAAPPCVSLISHSLVDVIDALSSLDAVDFYFLFFCLLLKNGRKWKNENNELLVHLSVESRFLMLFCVLFVFVGGRMKEWKTTCCTSVWRVQVSYGFLCCFRDCCSCSCSCSCFCFCLLCLACFFFTNKTFLFHVMEYTPRTLRTTINTTGRLPRWIKRCERTGVLQRRLRRAS